MRLVKTIVTAISADSDDQEIVKLVSELLLKQMLKRWADEKHPLFGSFKIPPIQNYNSEDVLHYWPYLKVTWYLKQNLPNTLDLFQFIKAFRHDYQLRSTHR